MRDHYSLVIVGAGPAGLAAAVEAAQHGLDVALLDEQPAPGGQIYRAMESIPAARSSMLGAEYQHGRELVSSLRDSSVEYFPDTQAWSLNRKREIGVVRSHTAAMITSSQVLLANGAIERPLPFPGWTLPGVMNAGAGQILFKAHGIVPADGVVLAGSGPLLLLLAWQYLHAGVKIRAILDLTPVYNHVRALPYLPRALLAGHYLMKGMAYKKGLKRAGISTLHNISDLQANGKQKLESIGFRHKGEQHLIETDLLLTHFGVIPHLQLSRAAGCRHDWDSSQQCWRPQLDEWGNSSIDGILIAGDGGGIGGARTAEHSGRLAALQAVYQLGKIDQQQRDRLGRKDRQWMREDLHVRPFLDAFFHIPGKLLSMPDDSTIICRCEEVTAREIRMAVASGHSDSNQVKFLTRCGMGPCQGRQCADVVENIIAASGGDSITRGGHYRSRPPVTPLTMGQLASLHPEEKE
jgi:NADPH-dependent 2,4-dienoyl-CoA reductase/sulfur reductase-like enzyme/bacterioferritin-associated ferredoxin